MTEAFESDYDFGSIAEPVEAEAGPSTFLDDMETVFAGGEDAGIPEMEGEPDAPDYEMVRGKRRPNGGAAYERKVRGILGFAATALVGNGATAPDAAALYQYGASFSQAWGDVAARNKEVAKIIDALTTGTESPYLAAAQASLPLVLQLVRNHEPQMQPVPRGIKVPFTKIRFHVPFKIGISLGKLRAFTHDPDDLYTAVLVNNPKISTELGKRGIKLPIRRRGRD